MKQIPQKQHDKFSFNGRILNLVKENSYYHQFIFFEEISFDEEYSFKIKIVKSTNIRILIGFIDYEKQK